MAAPVNLDGRAGHFRWPRRSFSMAAPVAAMAAPVAAIATHLCPYEAQYKLDANLWSVDGETDGRDSLLTNSMQNIGK